MPTWVRRVRFGDGVRVNGPATITVDPINAQYAKLIVDADATTLIEKFVLSGPAAANPVKNNEEGLQEPQ